MMFHVDERNESFHRVPAQFGDFSFPFYSGKAPLQISIVQYTNLAFNRLTSFLCSIFFVWRYFSNVSRRAIAISLLCSSYNPQTERKNIFTVEKLLSKKSKKFEHFLLQYFENFSCNP